MYFFKVIKKLWQKKLFLCIGLDSDYFKIPTDIKKGSGVTKTIFTFNKKIIDTTKNYVCCYKPNLAFYESAGEKGITALRKTIDYVHKNYPLISILLDAKKSDVENTSIAYSQFVFDYLKADAVTLNPYLGYDSLLPFIKRKNKGIFILAKTSNPDSSEFQDLIVNHPKLKKVPLYQAVAFQVANVWNKYGNCGLVVGATYPAQLGQIRKIAPSLPILIPGIGTQKGDLKKTIQNAKDKNNQGFIINSSRDIIFASIKKDFAQTAKKQAKIISTKITQTL